MRLFHKDREIDSDIGPPGGSHFEDTRDYKKLYWELYNKYEDSKHRLSAGWVMLLIALSFLLGVIIR
jgi:hypothetical protein